MDDIEYLKRALEAEIERSNKILYEKLGKELVDEIYEKMDIALTESIIKRFDNLAGVSSIHVDKHKE